jgi:ubiquinone/menaquinone biosynthesis C-methylase UbiE
MSDDAHNQVVRESFARQVPLFSGADSPFARRPASTLSWIEPVSGDMIVLDVACGAGHATEPVAAKVRQVIGIDLTPELLDLGARRLRANGIANVLLQEGNAEALPFADESFDIVCCRSSLHHFGEPRRAVDEMVRVCRPGGRVVLHDLVAPSPEMRADYDDMHRRLDPSHVKSFCEAELAALVAPEVATMTYADTATIRLPIDIVLSDVSARDEVLARLGAELRGDAGSTGFEPAEEDGKIVVSFTTCIIHFERVVHERCDQCGFDGARYDDDTLVATIRGLGPQWQALLAEAGAELRARPEPDVWSALEYAAHSRDITALHAFGVELAIREDEPVVPAIDGDTLIEQAAAGYTAEDPDEVAAAVVREATRLADAADSVGPSGWTRGIVIGDRRSPIRALLEHALHDSLHHVDDVERGLRRLRA